MTTKSKPTQAAFIKQYNEEHREHFNAELFKRNEDKIIEELQKVVLSSQREQVFTIKVHSFTVVEDYKEINDLLYKYEEDIQMNKKKKKPNQYEFVNLKDSDIKILKVKYFISAKEKSQYLDVLIIVPRIVDKYYFRISGNYYSAMYQIVDASTYNNSTSANAKKPNITLKTTFGPIKIFRNTGSLETVYDGEIKHIYYTIRAFNKSFNAFKYLLAKFGLYETMKLSGIGCIQIYNQQPEQDENMYTITKNNIYISIPKYIYNHDYTAQTLFNCIHHCILKDTKFNDLFTNEFWIQSLGGEFSNYSILKGDSVLKSIESIYDITTREDIRLPEDCKSDVYRIIRWMMREFNNLKNKDNLDISTKRIRCEEYIPSLYAMKLSQGIYRLSDSGNRVTVDQIKKSINIRPTYLLESISKCKLINYRNLVNDLDSLIAIKYTHKGISGIGEKNTRNVPNVMRYLHPSQLGRIDPDASPKSDPGMSGILCPLTELYGKSFSQFQEPNFWDQEFEKVMNQYKSLVGLKEVFKAKEALLNDSTLQEEISNVEESINTLKRLFIPVKGTLDTSYTEVMSPSLEEGGRIYYE